MVRDNGLATFYVNGVDSGGSILNPGSADSSRWRPPGQFSQYRFAGLLDEVRVFTFAPGTFSTSDLLLNRGL